MKSDPLLTADPTYDLRRPIDQTASPHFVNRQRQAVKVEDFQFENPMHYN